MRIAIVGMGRMGSWLAGALSEEHDVAVYDADRERCKDRTGVHVLGSLGELETWKPRMVVNVVSLENTVAVFRDIEGLVEKECILSDLASIKGDVADFYRTCGSRFVSVHPMFGPTFADMGEPKEESAVIISESDPEGAAFFREFLTRLGVKLVEYSFTEHDRMMAYSLTVPFVSSLVFAACLDHRAVPGTTFKKHRAIAEGLLSEDDHLLSQILFNPFSLQEIDRITQRLEFLKHVIKGKDYEEAHLFFEGLRERIR